MPALKHKVPVTVPSIEVSAAFHVLLRIVLLCAASSLFAQDGYLTGRRFQRQLNAPASIFWSDVELQSGLKNLAETRRLAVWLDRRCDPHKPISFAANLPRLRDCLWKLDQNEHVDVAWLPDIIYVGPTRQANRLATVHEIHRRQLDKLPSAVRNRWLSRRGETWVRLSNPVEILAKLERELGRTIQNKEKVLHDLWPARKLPPMPLYQRLELVLAGYGLTFTFDAEGGATIVSMPKSPTYGIALKIPQEKLDAVRQALEKERNASDEKATFQDGTLTASWRTHEAVSRIVTPPSSAQDFSRIRYTLKAESQEVGRFLRSICKQLNLECTFVDVSDETLKKRVSFEVEKATLQTLFSTILEPVGLSFTLAGNDLKIRKKVAD